MEFWHSHEGCLSYHMPSKSQGQQHMPPLTSDLRLPVSCALPMLRRCCRLAWTSEITSKPFQYPAQTMNVAWTHACQHSNPIRYRSTDDNTGRRLLVSEVAFKQRIYVIHMYTQISITCLQSPHTAVGNENNYLLWNVNSFSAQKNINQVV